MRIGEIKLKNFRQYKAIDGQAQSAKLSTDKDNNISIIEGPNGAGKTNLFNAIQWCLYNTEEIHEQDERTKKENNSLPIITESVIEGMEKGDIEEAAVEIIFYENGEPKYSVRRRKEFYKTNREGMMSDLVELSVQTRTENGWEKEDEDKAQELVYRILPEKVKEFYFFDGERLDEYFRAGTQKSVKEAIKDVSQVNLLEETLHHLKSTERQIDSEYKGGIGEKIRELSEDIATSDRRRKELKREIGEKQEERRKKKDEKKEIDSFLERSAVQEAKKLSSERKELDEDLKTLKEGKEEVRDKIKKLVGREGPLVLTQEAMEYALKEIKDVEEELGLPPEVQKSYVQSLLDKGECMCGTDLDSHPEKREALEKMKDKRPTKEFSNLANQGRFKIEEALSSISDFSDRSKELAKKLKELNRQIEGINNRLNEISESIRKIEDYDIQEKEERRNELEGDIDSLNREIGRLKGRMEDCEQEIERLEDNKRDFEAEKDDQKNLQIQSEAMKRSRDLLKEVRDEIMSEIREEIESKTESQFFDLIWKNDFVEVNIDEDYNIEVINRHGNNAINDLSAGERQALALSFMAALKRVSGYNAPVLIDTPLGRISEEPRENIAKGLPNYLKDTQVTLLVTNTEYDENFSRIIEDSVGEKYKLKYQEEGEEGITRVTR